MTPFCGACGGELELLTENGQPVEASRRPGFYRARCESGEHDGGVDLSRHPELLETMTRVELARPRITLVPMHPGRAQLGLKGEVRG